MESMAHKLKVDRAIFEKFSEYKAKVIYAYGLINGPIYIQITAK
jgi:hypothetical protein